MADYLREVEESMRAEKFARLWQEHGRILILACVALVIGTAAQTAWKSYTSSQNEKATALFLDAVKNTDGAAALQKIKPENDREDGALISIYLGNLAVQKGDWVNALAAYNDVISNRKAPTTYRDLAIVQSVAVQIDHDTKVTSDDLLKTLSPLLDPKTSMWSSRAILLTAIIQGDKQKKYTDAITTLKPLLADTSLPSGFMAQISALEKVYTLKGLAK